MDFVFEIILELILEGSIEIGANKKVSKWIRYPLLLIAAMFYFAVISFKDGNILAASLMWILSIALILGTGFVFLKKYKQIKDK